MVDYESIIVVIVINVVKCSGNILFYWEQFCKGSYFGEVIIIVIVEE